MNDNWSALVVLLLRYPHLLERGQAGQDASTDPHRILPFRRRYYLDLHRRRCQIGDFLLDPISYRREHGTPTRQYRVGVQILPYIHVAPHDRVVGCLCDTRSFHSQERRLEHCFRTPEIHPDRCRTCWTQSGHSPESFASDGDDLAVWKLVGLLHRAGIGRHHQFLLKIDCDVANLFLEVSYYFPFSGRGEAVAPFRQDLH